MKYKLQWLNYFSCYDDRKENTEQLARDILNGKHPSEQMSGNRHYFSGKGYLDVNSIHVCANSTLIGQGIGKWVIIVMDDF